MDLGCHLYLQWQTVFGAKPKAVSARGRILATGRPELAGIAELATDTAVVTVEYESGDIGALTVSWGLPAGCKLRGRPDRVFGPCGGAERAPEGLKLYEGDRVETVPLPRENLHQKALARFAEAVEAGRPPPYGFREGKEMLALTLAILQSVETGGVVPVSYDF
jgi:predicted dehydrogenase